MYESVLMVAMEAGSASYLAPLIANLNDSGNTSYRLYASDVALDKLKSLGFHQDSRFFRYADLKSFSASISNWNYSIAILSATGHSIEKYVIEKSRRRSVRSVGFVDTYSPLLPRFTSSGEVSLPDRIFLIDEEMLGFASDQGLPSDRLMLIGQPSWEMLDPAPTAPEENVLFVDQPVRKFYGDSLGYDEVSAWSLVHKAVQFGFFSAKKLGFLPHPTSSSMTLGAFSEVLNPDNPALVIEDGADCLEDYGTVVGMFSSLLIEAFLMSKTVLSVQPGLPPHDMFELSRRGWVNRVGFPESFSSMMRTTEEFPLARRFSDSMQGSLMNLITALRELV